MGCVPSAGLARRPKSRLRDADPTSAGFDRLLEISELGPSVLTVLVDSVQHSSEEPFDKSATRRLGEGRPHVSTELGTGTAGTGLDAPGDAFADSERDSMPFVTSLGRIPSHRPDRFDSRDLADSVARNTGNLLADPEPCTHLGAHVVQAFPRSKVSPWTQCRITDPTMTPPISSPHPKHLTRVGCFGCGVRQALDCDSEERRSRSSFDVLLRLELSIARLVQCKSEQRHPGGRKTRLMVIRLRSTVHP